MKTFFRLSVLAASAVFFVRSAPDAHAADPLIMIDFENGRKGFSVEGGAGFRIVDSPVREGSKAGRFQMGNGRTELASDRMPKDTVIWAGWSVMIDPEFNEKDANISQFHGFQQCVKKYPTTREGGAIHKILWDSGKIRYELASVPNRMKKSFDVDTPKGKWIDFVVNAKFSTSGGFFHLWINGKKFTVIEGRTFGVCPEGPYFKAGVYKGADGGTNPKAVVYVDGVKIMKNASYADVAPKGSARPADGGVGGPDGGTSGEEPPADTDAGDEPDSGGPGGGTSASDDFDSGDLKSWKARGAVWSRVKGRLAGRPKAQASYFAVHDHTAAAPYSVSVKAGVPAAEKSASTDVVVDFASPTDYVAVNLSEKASGVYRVKGAGRSRLGALSAKPAAGRLHSVLVSRKKGSIDVSVDGRAAGSVKVAAPSAASRSGIGGGGGTGVFDDFAVASE